LPADAGVVISASHNSYHDNGIKVFDPSGRKLDDATERAIEEDIYNRGPLSETNAANTEFVKSEISEALRSRYLDYLANEVARDLSLSSLTMVIDCANGAAFEIAPELFSHLGARVIAINAEPDGRNINRDCGSLHIEGLQSRVLAERADLGVAFDGDADRALFVDATGEIVDGDATMWVLANYLKSRGELIANTVVATVMSNIGLEIALRSQGIDLKRTDVGDKYVLEELIRSGASLGGEQSGHIIFPKLSLAGDGLITTIALLRVVHDMGSSLAQLKLGMQRYPQLLLNVRVREKKPFDEIPVVHELTRTIENQLGNQGRLLLRYSGTEPLARIMIEGPSDEMIRTQAETVADVLRSELA
jgi:phosphoglucosamine mutase